MRARNRYLLRLHLRVAIDVLHLAVHLGLGGAVLGRLAGLDLRGVHVRLLAVVLLWGEAVAAEGVVWRGHGLVAWVGWLLRDVLLGDLARAGSWDSGWCGLAWRSLCRGALFAGHNVN